jgi:hypothetical protein
LVGVVVSFQRAVIGTISITCWLFQFSRCLHQSFAVSGLVGEGSMPWVATVVRRAVFFGVVIL